MHERIGAGHDPVEPAPARAAGAVGRRGAAGGPAAGVGGEGHGMKVVDAKVIVTCPGRNFATLKLTTDDGLTGVGDATLNGRELAVASYLDDHVRPLLIGREA